MPKSLGLFGGTFDPPHIGHLMAALEVGAALELDAVHMVVAGDPWQKSSTRDITDAEIRLELTALACAPYPPLVADGREVGRSGASYTVDTVEAILAKGEADEVFVILGADAASRLETWHRVQRLLDLATIVVVDRPGGPSTVDLPGSTTYVKVDTCPLEISSTEIRERVRKERPVEVLTTPAVAHRIHELGLYS